MDWEKEKLLRASILHVKGIGSRRLRQLLAHFGSAEKVWKAKDEDFLAFSGEDWIKELLVRKKEIDPQQLAVKLKKENISLVTPREDNYPYLLGKCSDAPPLLFYKGRLIPSRESIAVVGSRRATAYGKAATLSLAKEIAREGFVVISGLARGIDTCAHQGALEADGITWAFLAGGLDDIYPSENKALAQKILRKGALISEYPPGMPPEPGFFPARNRLISGSSRGVLVVEAAQKSGSLITADYALEQGREVYAVPGPIFSELSKGTHQLLRMGAKLVENVQDIVSELGGLENSRWLPASQNKEKPGAEDSLRDADENGNLCEEHRQLLEMFSDIPLHIDQLTLKSNFPPEQIVLYLLELQLQERIIQLPGQYYVLNRYR